MAEFEITLKMWVIDDDPESIAQMCQELADGFTQSVAMDYHYHGIDPTQVRSGLVNVSFQQVFSDKKEQEHEIDSD